MVRAGNPFNPSAQAAGRVHHLTDDVLHERAPSGDAVVQPEPDFGRATRQGRGDFGFQRADDQYFFRADVVFLQAHDFSRKGENIASACDHDFQGGLVKTEDRTRRRQPVGSGLNEENRIFISAQGQAIDLGAVAAFGLEIDRRGASSGFSAGQ